MEVGVQLTICHTKIGKESVHLQYRRREDLTLVSVRFLLSSGTLRDALDALATAGAGVGGCCEDVIIVVSAIPG